MFMLTNTRTIDTNNSCNVCNIACLIQYKLSWSSNQCFILFPCVVVVNTFSKLYIFFRPLKDRCSKNKCFVLKMLVEQLEISTLFTTFFLWTSFQFMLYNYIIMSFPKCNNYNIDFVKKTWTIVDNKWRAKW